jgi:alpha-L-rhamnosidase
MDASAVGVFSPVAAKYYKLKTSGPSWVTGVELTGGARLTDWATKSHAAPGSDVNDPAVISNVPASSIINPATVIDVSKYLDSEGILHWIPKNGTYTVVRLGYTVTGQYMPAQPDGYNGKLYPR